MKKIAFIVWDYTVTGGIERVLTNLANELCDYYDVHIISLTKSGDRVPYKIDERVNRVYFATDEPLRGREVIKKGASERESHDRKGNCRIKKNFKSRVHLRNQGLWLLY